MSDQPEQGGTIQRRGKWTFNIDKDFVCNTALSKDARFLWIVLASFCSPKEPNPFPSTKLLRKLLGVSKETLAKYGRELIKARYMEKIQRNEAGVFKSNSYILNDEPWPSFPSTVNPTTEKPCTENPSTKSTQGIEEVPLGKDSTKGKAPAPLTALEIYALYPRKVGRPKALKAIEKAIKTFGADVVKAATERFAATWQAAQDEDMQFCPHPATWFNQERFNDAPETWTRGQRSKVDRQREPVREMKNSGVKDWSDSQ